MTRRYLLEEEYQKAYEAERANYRLVNGGEEISESQLEETVKNGHLILTRKQAQNLLVLIESVPLNEAYKQIAEEFGIKYSESQNVIKALQRNNLVDYQKNKNQCTLTKKGKTLRNGKGKRK